MFEIIAVVCLVADFGNGSSNECFFLEKGDYQTRAACMREADKSEARVKEKLQAKFGDDYVYIMQSACGEKERGT